VYHHRCIDTPPACIASICLSELGAVARSMHPPHPVAGDTPRILQRPYPIGQRPRGECPHTAPSNGPCTQSFDCGRGSRFLSR